MDISLKRFNTTKTSSTKPADIESAVIAFLEAEKTRYSNARTQIEETWLEAWALYLGTPQAVDAQRQHALFTLGDINTQWRHKLSTGKAYEIVETIHGYLMSATFPSGEWFNMSPNAPGYAQLARVVRKFLANKFEDANFRSYYSAYLRQLLIIGTSVIAVPWRYDTRPYKKNVVVKKQNFDPLTETESETYDVKEVEELRVYRNHPEFEVVDVFDCWLDPSCPNPNDGGFFRRVVKSRAEVIQLANSGCFDISEKDVIDIPAYRNAADSAEQDELRFYQGIETDGSYSMHDKLELIEYWGDVSIEGRTFHEVCAVLLGKHLVKFEPNPFWGGRPFIVGSCIPTPQSPYSVSVLQPNLGLLHQLNVITNQRLDNLELNIDTVLLVRQDGVLNPEDVFVAPGKTIYVTDPAAVQPLQLPQNQAISYTEASVLEQTIDKNAGTGAMVSANTARSGERVTAAEIQATRDAGGNRLSNLQAHIEATSLKPLLYHVYRSAQQFVTEDELVRVSGRTAGEFAYFSVGAQELSYDFNLRPVGSEHVIDRTKYVQDRVTFLQAVAQIPQMAERINYEAMLYDIVQHFGFEDPDSYIVQPQDPAAGIQQQLPVAPGSVVTQGEADAITDTAYGLSEPMGDAVKANFTADGGRNLLKDTIGTETNPQQAVVETL